METTITVSILTDKQLAYARQHRPLLLAAHSLVAYREAEAFRQRGLHEEAAKYEAEGVRCS